MSEQTYISESGGLESQPLTWDHEPLYSPETVREGLFDAAAFKQVRGQLALTDDRQEEGE
jgi:hypothetical protein